MGPAFCLIDLSGFWTFHMDPNSNNEKIIWYEEGKYRLLFNEKSLRSPRVNIDRWLAAVPAHYHINNATRIYCICLFTPPSLYEWILSLLNHHIYIIFVGSQITKTVSRERYFIAIWHISTLTFLFAWTSIFYASFVEYFELVIKKDRRRKGKIGPKSIVLNQRRYVLGLKRWNYFVWLNWT